jgi:hypothetical protein
LILEQLVSKTKSPGTNPELLTKKNYSLHYTSPGHKGPIVTGQIVTCTKSSGINSSGIVPGTAILVPKLPVSSRSVIYRSHFQENTPMTSSVTEDIYLISFLLYIQDKYKNIEMKAAYILNRTVLANILLIAAYGFLGEQ